MRKTFLNNSLLPLLGAVLLVATAASSHAEDRFALAVGTHETLVVFGDKGDRVAELPVPSISTPVTVGSTSFVISYGRDANDMLTAIISPNPSEPHSLNFTVLDKSVTSDKAAVVTLTFNRSLKSVTVDPGYLGVVQVNSRGLHRRSLSDDNATPLIRPVSTVPAPTVRSNADSTDITSAAPVSAPAPRPVSRPVVATTPSVNTSAPASVTPASPREPVPGPEVPPAQAAAESPSTSSNPAAQDPVTSNDPALSEALSSSGQQLFWAEPVTPPDGVAPHVASNEMKLVEVHGPVSIRTADGSVRTGENGMVVPSGSTVVTGADSSAALFMGGVNSARMLSDSEVEVSQQVSGSKRDTTVNLHTGTVFSRVGHRPGETQDYQVRTPEGVAAARGTEFFDHRANSHHYVYVAKGVVELTNHNSHYKTLTGHHNDIGAGSMPAANDTGAVFVAVMQELQPFDVKLQAILLKQENGTPLTLGEATFLADLKSTFYEANLSFYDPNHPNDIFGPISSLTGYGDSFYSHIATPQNYQYLNPLNPFNGLVPPERRALDQDFQPFGTQPLTGY